MHKTLILLSFLILGINFKSQAQATDLNSVSFDQRPQVLPPSPEAQKFNLYSTYPVSLATGIPDISVPIYTISLKSFSFPISVSYHASGFKPSETDGIIGLGWSLMANQRISRSVKGLPDEKYPNTILQKITDPTLDSVIDYMTLTFGHDTEYDEFNYSTTTESGKYLLKRINGQFIPMLIPYKPSKIEILDSDLDTKITDQLGNQYYFGKDLDNVSQTETSSPLGAGYGSAKTSWLLTHVVTKDKDTLRFYYDDYVLTNGSQPFDKYDGSTALVSMYKDIDHNTEFGNSTVSYSASEYFFTAKRLTHIESKYESVQFNYTSNNYWSAKLSNISVSNRQGAIIENVNLIQGNYLNSSRMKLKKVSFLPSTGDTTQAPSYKFTYNEIYTVPDYNNANTELSDYWGYYGPKSFFPPSGATQFLSWTGNNNPGTPSPAFPSFDRTSTGIIQSVTYPTGGKSVFQFSLNSFRNYNNFTTPIGGLRIASITSYDQNGLFVKKKLYKYGTKEDGQGYVAFDPYDISFRYNESKLLELTSHYGELVPIYKITFYSAPLYSVYTNGAPIYYSSVTEYDVNNDNIYTDPTTSNASVNGKTVSTFELSGHFNTFASNYSYFMLYNCGYYSNRFLQNVDSWYGYRPSTKIIYKNQGIGYTPLTMEVSNYHFIERDSLLEAKFFPTEVYLQADIKSILVKQRYAVNGCGAFTTDQAIYRSGAYVLDSLTTTKYEGTTQMVTQQSFTYEPTYLFKRTESTTSSDNKLILKNYKYAFDYTIAPYTQLLSNNRIGEVIELSSFKNNSPQYLRNVGYKDWGNGVIEPETINEQIGNNSIYTKIRYLSYDPFSNPTSIKQESGVPVSYIYGYYNKYPIAEVKNAGLNDIYYNGFEDAEGNSIVGDSKTGSLSRLAGYQKTISNIDNGNYTLTYWQKVSGNWILQSGNVTIAGNSYTINISGQVDEVRLIPVAAQMTSYAYSPLVGITSIDDAKNLLSYFQYDVFNRLTNTVDNNQNIKKSYSYYINESPVTIYINDLLSQAFTPNNCGSGLVGSPVTYFVPAGKYTSLVSKNDAINKGLNDISANGQAYANANGACHVPSFSNVTIYVNFQKNDCSTPGTEGQVVNYSVAAGKYLSSVSQADADNQAYSEANSSGQTYANAHGICSHVNNISLWGITYQVSGNNLNMTLTRPSTDATTTNTVYFRAHRNSASDLTSSFAVPANSTTYSKTVSFSSPIGSVSSVTIDYVN